ncbi:sensor histidine kinase [Niveispirillum sp.]|uniref:sensor histidine kinase n=1 Tax=Niveispirillum sp. TaxID=1917217 RepID=UPI001B6053B3|nr:sensor histidine kinase [Niveispirillum sp.]MBP7338908.1 sensor histidine kinase [Niveispirillum sp.]
MKNWLDHCPAFVGRLWFQFAVIYTLLAFCAMTLLSICKYGAEDYGDFRKAVTLEHVRELVSSEKLSVAQAIRDVTDVAWRQKACENIREKLKNIEQASDGSVYRITNSSRPEVYIQIEDENNRLVISDPVDLPAELAPLFTAMKQQRAAADKVIWMVEDGPIWVDMPIDDGKGNRIGRVRILYVAEFDAWIQIQSIFNFLLGAWGYVILFSVPIGIACGVAAAHYVTRHLGRMNDVTESWRRGDFTARIALPNDDVLIRHSQHLNDMADDLELYLHLKQNLAVSDERNRVARELHDTVKQKLFALGLQLATAKANPAVLEAAREPILEAETINREAQHDLMEIITQLRPTSTGDSTLHNRVGMIAEDFRRRFDVDIELGDMGAIQPNAHVEHQVLRILQEALMNAVRHGKASKVTVAAAIDGSAAMLVIADNGIGFEMTVKTKGFGIISMRDRARDLPDGRLDIESAEGEGTRLTISWKSES